VICAVGEAAGVGVDLASTDSTDPVGDGGTGVRPGKGGIESQAASSRVAINPNQRKRDSLMI